MSARTIGVLISLLVTAAALADEPADAPVPAAAPAGAAAKEGFAPKRPWLGEACRQDFTTNCSTLPANSKRDDIVQCLKSHEAVLSEECRSALADRPPGYGRFAGRGEGPEMGGMGRHGRRGGAMGGGGGYSSGNETNPASTIPPSADSEDTKRMLGDR